MITNYQSTHIFLSRLLQSLSKQTKSGLGLLTKSDMGLSDYQSELDQSNTYIKCRRFLSFINLFIHKYVSHHKNHCNQINIIEQSQVHNDKKWIEKTVQYL